MCPPGSGGVNCEVPLDPCHPDPCKNGGECIPSASDDMRCRCLVGFFGPLCEVGMFRRSLFLRDAWIFVFISSIDLLAFNISADGFTFFLHFNCHV